jgi:predicted xylose isomerase-like sugar epimerase
MSVKKRGISIVFLAMLTTALLSSTILLAEDTEGETVRLEGFVSVLRDANDAIISVQLVTDEDTYKVVLDEKGLELGEEMEYEKVEVEGIVSEKDEQKWLKVLKFKAIEEEQ